jgi:hypothetical protein
MPARQWPRSLEFRRRLVAWLRRLHRPPRKGLALPRHCGHPSTESQNKRRDCFALSGTCIGPLKGVTKSNAGETSPHYGLAFQIHIRSMA